MFRKNHGRHDVANGPVVHIRQEGLCACDAFVMVLDLSDEKGMKHILVVETMRQLLHENLMLVLFAIGFRQLA